MNNEPVISVEIAAGELIDKITILEIKAARITDPHKLANVRRELATLAAARERAIQGSHELHRLTMELKTVNESLWEIEDQIRECERKRIFDAAFVDLARSVYKTNDKRSAVKRQINLLLGSRLMEEKSYRDYD